MKNIVVDCRKIDTPAALQIYLQYKLSFPAWYGRNLDALYDLLTEPGQPVNLELITGQQSPEMTEYLKKLRHVLTDAASETSHFSWTEKVEK